jgi:putative lipoprotein
MKKLILAVAAATLVGCGADSGNNTVQVADTVQSEPAVEQAMATIEGSVFYRERMMLPPGFTLEVELQDVSRADAAASILATFTAMPDGGPPYPFSIEYDPGQIDDRMRYSLRATLRMDDKLLFTSTEHIDPFAGNPLTITVHKVASRTAAAATPLEGVRWGLVTLMGEEAGMGAGDTPVELAFNAADQSAGGFSGCNRYNGGYQLTGNSHHGTPLKFANMAGTMKACMDGMELEARYLVMLVTVTAYRIHDGQLVLMAGGEEAAIFEPL